MLPRLSVRAIINLLWQQRQSYQSESDVLEYTVEQLSRP